VKTGSRRLRLGETLLARGWRFEASSRLLAEHAGLRYVDLFPTHSTLRPHGSSHSSPRRNVSSSRVRFLSLDAWRRRRRSLDVDIEGAERILGVGVDPGGSANGLVPHQEAWRYSLRAAK